MRGDTAAMLAHIDAEGAAFARALASPEAHAAFASFMAKGATKQ